MLASFWVALALSGNRVGRWSGPIVGLPTGKLASVPLLGNGYAGVVLGSQRGAGGGTHLDLWINTNAVWHCDPSHTPTAPPKAVCARAALGGVTFTLPAAVGVPTLKAEQRITPAQLYAEFTTPARSVLGVLVIMGPEDNLIVSNLTWTPVGPDPARLAVNVSQWVFDVSNGAGAASAASQNGVLVASRQLGSRTGTVRSVWTAMATAIHPAGAMTTNGVVASVGGPQAKRSVSGVAIVSAGSPTSVVTAVVDNLVEGNAHDPTPDAAARAAAANPGEVTADAASFWQGFWAKSSVSLPTFPEIEDFWHGAQYVAAGMSASGSFEAKHGGLIPPSGLYGPWVTSDSPSWNGDYTLDYNQEAQYYGFYSSNHGEFAEAYFAPILDWMPAAKLNALGHCAQGNFSCPSNALHFACHLAPWGYQSRDTSTYMHWNGNFAALLFINKWEYTRNVTWVKETAYPLLDGLNAWWSAYLVKGADGVYVDYRGADPDEEHEGQKDANPQIGLALIKRTMLAQLDMAEAMDVAPPPRLQEILGHFPAWNTATTPVKPPPPGPRPAPAPPAPPMDCSKTGSFTPEPGVRCEGDFGETMAKSAQCCQAWCEADASCAAFTYCATDDCHAGHGAGSCWKYRAASKCANGTGFISGRKESSAGRTTGGAPASVGRGPPQSSATVFTAYANATADTSDGFALYPIWPSELVNGLDAVPGLAKIARASFVRYFTGGTSNGAGARPVLVYPAAVRAGACDDPEWCRTAAEVLADLQTWLKKAQTPSYIPVANGGGTENIGVSVAVNDMLVQAPSGKYIVLFPFWPADQPASFSGLLVKGGFEVSAAQSAAGAVAHLSVVALNAGNCTFKSPWPAAGTAGVSVACGSTGSTPVSWSVDKTLFSFAAPAGVNCTVTCRKTPAPL